MINLKVRKAGEAMFGYVRIRKPELRVAEYETYRGVYCSLCRELGRRYGLPARLTLSYDFTFLALLRMALDDDDPSFRAGRCPFNPSKRCAYCNRRDHTAFAADAAVLLTYYKLRDALADEGFWRALPARLALPFAALARRKAARLHPELDALFSRCLQKQAELERARTSSLDAAAEPTALMLAALAQEGARDETERRIRERFGYCLGRWIYLADAADDLAEDERRGRYNPFSLRRQAPPAEEPIPAAPSPGGQPSADIAPGGPPPGEGTGLLPVLNATLAEGVAAYNLLDIRRYDGILRNILERGLPAVQARVLSPEGSYHERERSV